MPAMRCLPRAMRLPVQCPYQVDRAQKAGVVSNHHLPEELLLCSLEDEKKKKPFYIPKPLTIKLASKGKG